MRPHASAKAMWILIPYLLVCGQMAISGCATLETHWRIGTQMEDALMARPQGGGFSAGGEAASRICLDILHRKYGFGA